MRSIKRAMKGTQEVLLILGLILIVVGLQACGAPTQANQAVVVESQWHSTGGYPDCEIVEIKGVPTPKIIPCVLPSGELLVE